MRPDNLPPLDLSGAFLRRTSLSGAILKNANFAGADFQNARFVGSDFEGADLTGTNLVGADLTGAKNLTADQLRRAIIDETTRLPTYIDRTVLTLEEQTDVSPAE
ncbi:pentapeptide repeat-containing protein [Roseitalea porphyridii]|uniref:Pentapeptide repeat-containing protein n=1 Tax=Roseitalea porphyridii TaxID=1852022 RepID=A0A4P6V207_9HYPH|nr:pentapeptide repeat-containing protein [Roseitalea porphyridii]QBK30699.1 pentapeptide repeat-containing protein [Roseitalea porphyridii]